MLNENINELSDADLEIVSGGLTRYVGGGGSSSSSGPGHVDDPHDPTKGYRWYNGRWVFVY
jgi:hypothetical protein